MSIRYDYSMFSFFVALQPTRKMRTRAGTSTSALTQRENGVTFSSGQMMKVDKEQVQGQELLPPNAVGVKSLDTPRQLALQSCACVNRRQFCKFQQCSVLLLCRWLYCLFYSLTVTKDTVNKGRKFYKCPKEKQCHFFEWADAEKK